MSLFKKTSLFYIIIVCLLLVTSSSCGNVMNTSARADVSALVGSEFLAAQIFPDVVSAPSQLPVVEPARSFLLRHNVPEKPQDSRIYYQVQPGDTLQAVAAHFGVTVDQIASSYPLSESGLLPIGQLLKIDDTLGRTTPSAHLLPDGEVIYSPSASDFDLQKFANSTGGFLTTYEEFVPHFKDAEGWEVIEYVASVFSINPRLLFSLLEYQSHWVYGWPETDNQEVYPLGMVNESIPDLNPQVTYAAKQISIGYYGWRDGTLTELIFKDGTTLRLAPTLNAGTVGLMQFLSKVTTQSEFYEMIDPDGDFIALHTAMFGDPWQRAAEFEPLIPDGLTQPEMILPFEVNAPWFYSSGPHPAWSEVGSNAALDFTPQLNVALRCTPVEDHVVASASGTITHLSSGLLYLDLDGDGDPHTGWVLMYLHLDWSDVEELEVGAQVEVGQILGYPSCLRGRATNTHVHIARMYNGEWMAAGGAVPFVLSGWQAHDGPEIYDGTLTRGDQELIACFCGWTDAQLTREEAEILVTYP